MFETGFINDEVQGKLTGFYPAFSKKRNLFEKYKN